MYDSYLFFKKKQKPIYKFLKKKFILLTIHREENSNLIFIKKIVKDLKYLPKDNLIIWVLSAHNNVNKINKNNKNITVDDFYKFYNDEYKIDVTVNTCKTKCEMPKEYNMINESNCDSDNYKMLSIVLFGVLITLGLFLYRNMQLNNN